MQHAHAELDAAECAARIRMHSAPLTLSRSHVRRLCSQAPAAANRRRRRPLPSMRRRSRRRLRASLRRTATRRRRKVRGDAEDNGLGSEEQAATEQRSRGCTAIRVQRLCPPSSAHPSSAPLCALLFLRTELLLAPPLPAVRRSMIWRRGLTERRAAPTKSSPNAHSISLRRWACLRR